MVVPCTCCDVDLANEHIVALVTRFKQIDKNDVKSQKKFVYKLISASFDGDSYLRCFEISDGQFLCRSGVSFVLQLNRRMQKDIVPSALYITHLYHIACIAEILSALVVYQTCMLQKAPSHRDRMYEEKKHPMVPSMF
jgi:hypothetical protein